MCVFVFTRGVLVVVLFVLVVAVCGGGDAEVRGRVAGVAVVLSVGCALWCGIMRA